LTTDNPYSGPAMQPVPIGWFQEAAELAANAPAGMAIHLSLIPDGFLIRGETDDRQLERRVTFLDMAMEEDLNPLIEPIAAISASLRA
jgi:hypothetical protein